MAIPRMKLMGVARDVCYARGLADACEDIMFIANDEDMSVEDRLKEIIKYNRESVMYKPVKPLPTHPPYRKATDEGWYLEDEQRHGYIIGRSDAIGTAAGIAAYPDPNEALRDITAFCRLVTDIVYLS